MISMRLYFGGRCILKRGPGIELKCINNIVKQKFLRDVDNLKISIVKRDFDEWVLAKSFFPFTLYKRNTKSIFLGAIGPLNQQYYYKEGTKEGLNELVQHIEQNLSNTINRDNELYLMYSSINNVLERREWLKDIVSFKNFSFKLTNQKIWTEISDRFIGSTGLMEIGKLYDKINSLLDVARFKGTYITPEQFKSINEWMKHPDLYSEIEESEPYNTYSNISSSKSSNDDERTCVILHQLMMMG